MTYISSPSVISMVARIFTVIGSALAGEFLKYCNHFSSSNHEDGISPLQQSNWKPSEQS